MKVLVTAIAVIALAPVAGPVGADELLFFDDFEDGPLDGWHTFGVEDHGYEFWIQDGELWGRASDGWDCCHCPDCRGVAVVDDIVVGDLVLEVELTNRNACGWFGLLMRVTEDTWSGWDQIDYWEIGIDPGATYIHLGASGCEGIQDWDFHFGTHVPHYFRVVLVGQTMELWDKLETGDEYELLYTLSCDVGPTEGHVGIVVAQSAKHASFDDFAVYLSGTSPVESSTWTSIKSFYR